MNFNMASALSLAASVFATASVHSAEYRLERRGDALEALVGGRRFAVLSPAEGSRWTLTHDSGGKNFIGFVFTPKHGERGTFRFPEIWLEGDASSMKAVGSQGFTTPGDNVGSAMYLAVAESNSCRGVVAAWLTSEKGSGLVKSAVSNDMAVLRPELQFGRVGASGCERFVLGAFDDCRLGLEAIWNETVAHMAEKGMNMVVMDLGEFMEFPSHPELAVKGSWSPDRMRAELKKLRAMGLEPIPKLNFSATHDQWLKVYHRMISTPQYYQVAKDVIRDTAEIFGTPRLFHLGWDEERVGYAHQKGHFSMRTASCSSTT